MKTYSIDLRQRIVDTYDQGGISQEALAERFCVSIFFVKKLFRQRRLKGSIAPLPKNGWQKSSLTPEIVEFLISLYVANRKLKLKEIGDGLETEFGIRFSNPTLSRTLKRLKLKK